MRLLLYHISKRIQFYGKLSILVCLYLYSHQSYSQAFLNGDLNGSVNFVSVPTSWVQIPDTDPICQASGAPQATVDILDATGPTVPGGVAGIPFSGTTFCSGLHSSDNGAFLWHEGIMQTVGGFTIGNSYSICFYQAVVKQQNSLDGSGSWRVYVDGTLIATTAVSTSALLFNDLNLQWDSRIVTFTATATTHTIKFITWDDDANLLNSSTDPLGGLRMGIDLISFVTPVDPTIAQAGPFCPGDPAINLTAATAGGTWSGTGITNTVNGTFDPATAGLGTWVITYTLTTGCGSVSDTMTINVVTNVDAGWTAPTGLCITDAPVDLAPFITGNPAGTWSGIGMTGSLFDPSAGTQPITYSVGTPPCNADSILIINVTNSQNPTFNYASVSYCQTEPDPTPTITGTGGGIFTSTPAGLSITPGSGLIDLSTSTPGTYGVLYTTPGPSCIDTLTVFMTVTTLEDATFNFTPTIYCQNDSDPTPTITGTIGGIFSSTPAGLSINSGTGMIDLSASTPGNYGVLYTTPSASCQDTLTVFITINPSDNAAFNYSAGSYCLIDPDPNPTITGTIGGAFTIDNSGFINSASGQINLAGSGIGNYIITYITNGPCPDTSTVNVIINNCILPPPVASFSASQTNICEGDCINFTDLSTSTAAGGITVWLWNFVGAITPTSSAQNPTNICYNTAGTYAVTLTVTDANGIDDSTIVNYITVSTCTLPTSGYLVSNDTICEGDCINFTDQSSGATSWLWTFNGGAPSSSILQNPTNICFNTAGTYSIEQIVTNANGSDTTTSTIVVNATPTITAGADVTIELGDNTMLNATGSNGTYTWSPPTWLSCVICVNPVSTPDETITYTVTIVDSNGCITSDNVTVNVDFDNVIWVANIFSPNGDGNNDILYVRGTGIAQLKFFVYDRWGEKVFETEDLNIGWDGSFRGKKMNNAVFVYYLEATFLDGSEVSQKGDVTLIR